MRVSPNTTISLFLTPATGLFTGQPTPLLVSPQTQTANSTVATPFSFVASDSDGAGDLPSIDALFESANQISFWNNDNGQNPGVWTTAAAGQPGLLIDSTLDGRNACRVWYDAQTANSNGYGLGMDIAIEFSPRFAGTKTVYERSANKPEYNSGYLAEGSYTVQ